MLSALALLAACASVAVHATNLEEDLQSCSMRSFKPFDASTAVSDTPATKVLLTDAANQDGAVCLDGTPSAYYFRPGTESTKFYIHHQGGGWCESLDDCHDRAGTQLGSSKDYPATADLGGGYFSQDPAQNPMMYNWNAVFLRYCDGGSFSGNNETVTPHDGVDLHFRGFRNLNAMIDDLMTNKGLDKATDIVVSGCSAGGLATYLHCDYWRSRVPKEAKQMCLPDSGFFLDVQFVSEEQEEVEEEVEEEERWSGVRGGVTDVKMEVEEEEVQVGTTIPGNYHDGLVWVFNQMNSTAGVHQDCIAQHMPKEDCIFAEISSLYIKTKTFAMQSRFDSWQAGHVIPVNNPQYMTALGANITARLQKNLLSHDGHGAILDSKYHHCGAWGELANIGGLDGFEQATAFMTFYYGLSNRTFFFQDEPYPCDAC